MDATTSLWPREAYEALKDDERQGIRALDLLINSHQWVHRRVESVTFQDDRTVRRRVSADFSIPRSAPRVRVDAQQFSLIPLTLLRKRTLVNFDLRDEDGKAIPLLSLRQTQALTKSMLRAWAKAVLEPSTITDGVCGHVDAIAAGTQRQLEAALDTMQNGGGQLAELWHDPRFRAVLNKLRENFVLFVPLTASSGSRRVVKYSYDEFLSLRYRMVKLPDGRVGSPEWEYISKRRPPAVALAYRPTVIRFPVPSSEHSHSYHFEVRPPIGTAIGLGTMLADRLDVADRSKQSAYSRKVRADEMAGPGKVNLHVVEVPPGSVSYAQVELYPTHTGWIRTALYTSWSSSIALMVTLILSLSNASESVTLPSWVRLPDLPTDLPATFFALVSGGVATTLSRPTHEMGARLLNWVSRFTTMNTILLFVAAALILILSGDLLVLLLELLLVLAVAWSTILTVVWFKNWRRASKQAGRLSVWVQGTAASVPENRQARVFENYADAEREYKHNRPAVIVESAEGERPPGKEDTEEWILNLADRIESLLQRLRN